MTRRKARKRVSRLTTDRNERQRNKILSFASSQIIAGRYRLLSDSGQVKRAHPEALGRGGSGVVYLAEQSLQPGVVIRRAVKFFVYRDDIAKLTAHRKAGPLSAKDFKDEIINLAGFTHENILKVIEGGLWKSTSTGLEIPFVVTEYIDGPTLKAVLPDDDVEAQPPPRSRSEAVRRRRQVAERDAVRDRLVAHPDLLIELILQLCAGVKHLHERDFYHCDIAPKNIFLRRAGPDIRLVIGDLGVGRTIPTNFRARKDSVFIVGTKSYAPTAVQSLINTQVRWTEFRKLQPRWDLYAVARCSEELLRLLPGHSDARPAWLEALELSIKSTIDGIGFVSIAEFESRVRLLHPVQHTIWDVGELAENAPGARQSLLPIDGVLITPRIGKLTHHPAVVRMKQVPQLVMASKVFHGGNHDRYEHLLGSYQNMRLYLLALLNDYKFLVSFSPAYAELALVASILVGIIRFPLSTVIHELHSMEPRLFAEFSRERVFDELFSKDPKNDTGETLEQVVRDEFPRVNLDHLRELVTGGPVRLTDPAFRFVNLLLNSSIDVRVLDYLRRDSLHLGIGLGATFDLTDLLRFIRYRDGLLVINPKGLTAVEQVIAMRYWLYNRIYWNLPNRTMIAMLKYVFRRLCAEVDRFSTRLRRVVLSASESMVLDFLRDEADDAKLDAVQEICEYLLAERPMFFYELLQFNRAEGDATERVACERYATISLEQKVDLQSKLNNHATEMLALPKWRQHILLDMPMQYGAMKLGEEINVEGYEPHGKLRSATKLSGIVEGVQKSFGEHIQRLRVLVHPDTYRTKRTDRRELSLQLRELLISSLV